MSDHTKIEWTDATWNPVVGCSLVSPGCTNCYAMTLAGTRLQHHPSRAGLTQETKTGPVWTGEVRFVEEWLDQPLRWRRPRRIFVCAHGDLFHENVPDEWIDKVFAVMALAPQHTFQILTKRPERMRKYLLSRSEADERGNPAEDIRVYMTAWLATPSWREKNPATAAITPRGKFCAAISWPLPNVWLGVSVEDQARADQRIPILLDTPAAVRWISAEPLLGPIDLTDIPWPADRPKWPETDDVSDARSALRLIDGVRLDWVVAGGESAPAARPMHPDWARSLRDQCAAAGVAFLLKQWGSWGPVDHSAAADESGWQGRGEWRVIDAAGNRITEQRWPSDQAGEAALVRVGKAAAGRTLDDVIHDAYPIQKELACPAP